MKIEGLNIPTIEKIIGVKDILEHHLADEELCRIYLLLADLYKKGKYKITPKIINKVYKDMNRVDIYDLLITLVIIGYLKKTGTHKDYSNNAVFIPNKDIDEIIQQKYLDICKKKLNIK